MAIDQKIRDRAEKWLTNSYDEITRSEVERLIVSDPEELTEAFYTDLEFGTGGLRGIMGVGTNRMNKYTVAMATQGLSNYLINSFSGELIKVAIAYDSRNNSQNFAEIAAGVFSANGFTVYLFESLRPTPELSFAVRHLKCHSGIVITASHNPKEYNGYKVYWNDGAQLVPPHDKNVIDHVRSIGNLDEVRFGPVKENIFDIGKEIDQAYLAKVAELSMNPEAIKSQSSFGIVYTPLHGTGITLVPDALKFFGFSNITILESQAVPDGNFPTVKSPNPEEKLALELAIAEAEMLGADLVMATDPDADRVGIAVRDAEGKFVLLNGNQTASILIWYILGQLKRSGKVPKNAYIIKTIVTTELLREIADYFGMECMDVLTGFKYIAEKIRENEGSKKFIAGGEESYGYLVGDFVRDKDAVISCCMLAEAAAYANANGKSIFSMLLEVYQQFGLYYESLVSVTKNGISGQEEIKMMMEQYRINPPETLNGMRIVRICDYHEMTDKNLVKGTTNSTGLPQSDVLQFFLEDNSKITVRPSGTEPKIKFYFGLKGDYKAGNSFHEAENKLKQRVNEIIKELGL